MIKAVETSNRHGRFYRAMRILRSRGSVVTLTRRA
jgi:hypothetical protein